jgi:hypothetical protein
MLTLAEFAALAGDEQHAVTAFVRVMIRGRTPVSMKYVTASFTSQSFENR